MPAPILILLCLLNSLTLNQTPAELSEPRLLMEKAELTDDKIWSGETTKLRYTTEWINTQNHYFTYSTDVKGAGIFLEDIHVKTQNRHTKEHDITIITLTYTLRIDENTQNSTIEVPPQLYPISITMLPNPKAIKQMLDNQNLPVTEKNITDLHSRFSKSRECPAQQLEVTHPQVAYVFNIIGMVLGALVLSSLLVLGIYYLFFRRKQQQNITATNEVPEDFAETIYQKYLEAKIKKTRRGLRNVIPHVRNLITLYICRKVNVKSIEAFYNLKDYDAEVKEGVKKFFTMLDQFEYGHTRLKTDELNRLEEDFRTLLFVI